MNHLFSKIAILFSALLLNNISCSVNQRQSEPPASKLINLGMKISEVEALVKKGGGEDTYLDIMSKQGSGVKVRSYWLEGDTVISLGVQNEQVVDIMLCRDADQAKAYQHWENVKSVALP